MAVAVTILLADSAGIESKTARAEGSSPARAYMSRREVETKGLERRWSLRAREWRARPMERGEDLRAEERM